jgi:hypothetical protein
VGQVPIYLYARSRFKEPIHAVGLNKCYALTTLYYILLFITIKGMIALTNVYIGLIFSIIITVTSCYVTSTAPNAKNKIGKLFFGYKKHSESKYEKLIEYIKFNGLDPELINAEEQLKKIDTQIYLVYKRKFREDKTFKEISEEFDLDNGRIVEILDKSYFYMIGALKL